MKRTPRQYDEHQIQVACVMWFYTNPMTKKMLLFSVPNGAKFAGNTRQRAGQWLRLEKEGCLAGTPDLQLCHPSGEFHGLFIEMKTPKGRQSDTQKAFEERALDAGYGYAICRSLEQFMDTVTSYIQTGEY